MRTINRFLGTTAGIAAGIAITGTIALAAPAAAADAPSEAAPAPQALTIESISNEDTEDWSGGDETYLRYRGGDRFWGPHHMDENSRHVGHQVNVGDIIEVWDEDGGEGDPLDEDDLIGELRITGAGNHQVAGDGAEYHVKVV